MPIFHHASSWWSNQEIHGDKHIQKVLSHSVVQREHPLHKLCSLLFVGKLDTHFQSQDDEKSRLNASHYASSTCPLQTSWLLMKKHSLLEEKEANNIFITHNSVLDNWICTGTMFINAVEWHFLLSCTWTTRSNINVTVTIDTWYIVVLLPFLSHMKEIYNSVRRFTTSWTIDS
jgi:hypothetical protein